jgi:hypothetical protein
MTSKVYVEMEGGLILSVYATGPVDVLVRDFDVDGVDPKQLSKEGKSTFVDSIWRVGREKWNRGETIKRFLNHKANEIERKKKEKKK